MIGTKRQVANRQLVEILATLVNQYPDLRFGQILSNFDFVLTADSGTGGMALLDEYHVEPEEILKRVTKQLGEIQVECPKE